MFVTASRDSSVNIFILSSALNAIKTQLKMERSSGTITSLQYVNESVVAAQLEASDFVDLWDLRDGKILESIRSDEIILDIFVMNARAVIICQSTENSKLSIKGLAANDNVTFNPEFRIEIDRSDFHRTFQSSSSLLILTESSIDSKIILYSLDYDDLKAKKPISPVSIKLDQLNRKNDSRLLHNTCLACSGLYVFLYYEELFYVIESRSGQLLAKDKIPANTSAPVDCLTPFQDSDLKLECIFARDSLNRLLLIQYNSQTRKMLINVVTRSDSKPLFVNSFSVNKDLLIVHSKQDSEIFICSANSLLKTNMIDELLFDIKLAKENKVMIIGLSMNNKYAYLLENRKILRFFNIKSKKEITGNGMPLYGEPRKILCTNDFVAIAMQDDRVISFLISEPERPDALARIEILPSRLIFYQEY